MMRGQERQSHEERWSELGFFNLERRQLLGEFIVSFQFLKGAYKLEGEQLFAGVGSDRTKRNIFKLRHGRFRLGIRRKCFTQRVMMHLSRLPRDDVDTLSLDALMARLDVALGSLV